MKHTCSYCNNETGKGYTFLARKYHPTIYKCKRRWCKTLRFLRILRKKVPETVKK